MVDKSARLLGIVALALLVVALAFLAADHIENNAAAQRMVEQFGVLGIFVLALVGGFNVVIPVHAASFTPVFLAAGISMPVVIIVLALGTTCADLCSYFIGKWSKRVTETKYPAFQEKIETFAARHRKLLIPGVFLYSALVPFPNEVVLIPLGLTGFGLWKVIVPLILGTVVNQTIFAFGFASVFEVLF